MVYQVLYQTLPIMLLSFYIIKEIQGSDSIIPNDEHLLYIWGNLAESQWKYLNKK